MTDLKSEELEVSNDLNDFEITLRKEEDRIANDLKEICDQNGKETNSFLASKLLHELGLVYQKKSPDKLSLIRSAALFNAALSRKSQNIDKIRHNLKQLCKEILIKANAKEPNADLIEVAKNVKKAVISMRSYVDDFLSPDISEQNSKKQERKKINQIRKLQNNITTDYTQIMADLSDYCKGVMGKAPCKFAVVGMGSLARKEITPYSDFEHIIVLEEGIQKNESYDEILEYFRWFSVIFQVVVINLEETILPCVSIRCLKNKLKYGDWFYDDFTTCGISFDSTMPHACKIPLGRQNCTKSKPWKTELIKSVSEMLKYLTTEEDLKNGYHLKDILTKICFVYGEKNIFDDFKSQMFQMLEEDDEQSRTNEIKRQILEDLENFSTRSTLPEIISSKEFNLKKVIYRSTTLFISALARLYNVRASSSFEIIEHLAEKNEISESTRHKLMYAIALACEIRLKWYMQCKNQNDFIKNNKGSAIQMLLSISTKNKIASYFRIAYALQCDISNRFNLKKKFFYSNPKLLNTNLYYCLEDIQNMYISIQSYIKGENLSNERLLPFEENLDQLEFGSKKRKIVENALKPKIKQEFHLKNDQARIEKCLFELSNYLITKGKYDEAVEFLKNHSNVLNDISKKNEESENIKKTPSIIPKKAVLTFKKMAKTIWQTSQAILKYKQQEKLI